jgi:tRNA threonylcarbamoyladenosine biosynthesis protein TsaE
VYRRPDGALLSHLDAYRLKNSREADALDIDLYLEQGPLVVEWAQKIEKALPPERMWLKLFWVDEERRRIEVSPQGKRYEEMVSAYQEAVYGLV